MDEFEMEMQQPEETPEKQTLVKRKNKKKMTRFGVIAFLICLCLLISNIGGCRKSTVEDLYVFENASNYQIMEYDGKVVTVGYDGIKFLNVDGSESTAAQVHMSSPHVSVAGDMILLYDKGNNNLTVFDGVNKKYSYECDQIIKSAIVNKNGYVVLITDEIAYNSRVTVLDDKGTEVYIWKIGDEYIVDADISPDNKRLVAATISTATGTVVENIVFVDINKAEETGRAQSDGTMPLQVKFAESGNAVVMSDTKLASYDYKAKKKWENSFDNNLLDYFTMDEDGNTVIALRGIKNNTVVRTYTKNGSNSGEYITETHVLHMGINQKYIAICEKNKVSLINFSGKLISEVEFKKEMRDVSVISDDKVIILCEDSIQLLRI